MSEEQEFIDLPNEGEGEGEGNSPATQADALENEARMNGWVPQEDWRGDPEDWRPADEFVRRGREINPILRRNNERLMTEIQKRDAEIAEMRSTFDEFKKFSEESRTRALEQQRQELMNRKKQAFEEDDFETVTQVDEDLRQLDRTPAPAPTPAAAPEPAYDPRVQSEVSDWFGQNTWYEDPKMRAVADGLGATLRAQYPDLVGAKFLDKVKEEMQSLMPHKFPSTSAPRVEGGAPPSGRTRPSGRMTVDQAFNKLPPEAKEACLKFEKQGLMTKQQYVKEYFGGDQ